MSTNNWYVITGAPSSGKSTVIAELDKLGHTVSQEFPRLVIDRELASGKTLDQINVDSPSFEIAWITEQHHYEKTLDPQQTIFFDRGILDTLGYFKCYDWPVPDEVADMCAEASYKKVFLFDPLDYEKDYARIETAETALKLHDLFGEVYRDAGYEVIAVPVDTVEHRVTFILDHL